MPWVKVWLHFVWSTHNRTPFLSDDVRVRVFNHIRENARKKDIYIDLINGYLDHVHALISLGTDQTLASVMQLVKGESSFWINKNGLTKTKFAWQDEYFVASVSPSSIEKVRRYIANQERHHALVSFDQELDGMLSRAGFKRFKDRWQ
jgi:putative transposase